MRKKRFIANVLAMSSSMMIIRIAGMAANIYITSRAGANAMGIYHMIFAIFTFGITFASAGTGFAVTRLVSEGKYDEGDVIKKCLLISGVVSLAGFGIFFAGAPILQKLFIKDRGAASALRLLAFALPCMGVSSVCRGYFIARRNSVPLTLSSIFEETVCIGVTIYLLHGFAEKSEAYMCLVYGCVVSNMTAFVFDTVVCKVYISKSLSSSRKVLWKSIFAICIPVALGSYLRTALVAVENLMIPVQFEKYGIENAVGEYGTIKAMAMSVIMFPTVFVQAFSSMLVPEMSEMSATGRKNGIRHIFSLSANGVMLFSTYVAVMLLSHHSFISHSLFEELKAAKYLGLLSLLAIPMYLDTVADSILKSLNLQNASLVYNIADSCLRICAMIFLMPRYGPAFYIAMLYISEIFNLTLSLGKAAKSTGYKPNWVRFAIIPGCCFVATLTAASPMVQTMIYIGTYALTSHIAKACGI